MKVQYTSKNGRLSFDFDGASAKEVFAKLALLQEVFEESACGMCKSEHIRFDVREYDGNAYHKMLCRDCGAQLEFGQKKVGGELFAKRSLKDSTAPAANAGWYRYQPKTGG